MSVTTWTRIEPDIQLDQPSVDMAEGLAAKLADPLWMLGRQWQMGELTGEDAASPVSAKIVSSSYLIDTLQIGTKAVRFSPAGTATEAEVENDAGKLDTRSQASGGVLLLDMLTEANLPAYRAAVQQNFPLDAFTPDGDLIMASSDGHTLETKLGITAADRPVWDTLIRAWALWYRERRPRPNPGWIADRLEYRFSAGVNVPEGRITLNAPEHNGDRVDWDSFTASAPVPGSVAKPVTATTDVAPSVLQIPGMPVLTFWEMEDPRFDPGRMEAGPGDVARLLLIETALAYAADWFLLPLRLPVASMTKIESLIVTDTFGVQTIIAPVDQVRPPYGWRLWSVSGLPYLLLPPPETGFLIAEPVEKAVFVRDEAANLAWALQLLPQAATPAMVAAAAASAGDLTYVPITAPPDDRIPLVMTGTDGERLLVRGKLTGQKTGPQGNLLPVNMRVRDEELPDAGLTLERRYELGRTPDGVMHLWVSKVKRMGARLPASGLTFDGLQ